MGSVNEDFVGGFPVHYRMLQNFFSFEVDLKTVNKKRSVMLLQGGRGRKEE